MKRISLYPVLSVIILLAAAYIAAESGYLIPGIMFAFISGIFTGIAVMVITEDKK